MLQLLFNFKIGQAQWPHLKVIRSARWPYVPWQLGHPPWQPQWLRRQLPRTGRPEIHVTNHWHSPGQTKQVDVSGGPQLYVAFLDLFFFFFFPLLLQTALNFLLDLISSVKKCHPKGPAEMLSGPAPLKKANNLFAHKEWKKMFLCFKDYWTPSFQNESVPSSRDNFH